MGGDVFDTFPLGIYEYTFGKPEQRGGGGKKLDAFTKHRAELDALCTKIMDSKRPAYTVMDKDPMRNFKSVGERVKLSPERVALIYFLKHVDAICSVIAAGNNADPEPLEGRIADARNYLDILYHLTRKP